MTPEELLESIHLIEELIATDRPNRPGSRINPGKITIHNTSNKDAGADAKMHSRFVRNTGYYVLDSEPAVKHWVSWHFSVDDKVAIRHLPSGEKAFHAGTDGNLQSLAIEICMHEGIDQEAANEKAARLAAFLCHDLSIPVQSVLTHQSWTGKKCPELLLDSWSQFVGRVQYYIDQLSTEKIRTPGNSLTEVKPVAGIKETSLCWTIQSEHTIAEHHRNLSVRVQNGFNGKFLEAGEVRLPLLTQNDNLVFLQHQNLSIYFNKNRKLALYAACNYNKDSFIEKIERSNSFRDDSLIDTAFQLGSGFYKSPTLDRPKGGNYFDQGHLIARRYNQWGDNDEEAKTGERDTYNYTSIHPQVPELNQDEWEKIESFIIERDKLDVKRVSIIAGCFLGETDPVASYIDRFYQIEKSIKIPQVFWKIVYYQVDGILRKIAFLMSQVQTLRKISFVHFETREKIRKDPFDSLSLSLRTYIVNSSIIESGTGLKFSDAEELYQQKEPLEAIIADNETAALEKPSIVRLSDYI